MFAKMEKNDYQLIPIELELLTITGDVIDGRESSTPGLEENYNAAIRLLTARVIMMWSTDTGIYLWLEEASADYQGQS